MATLWTWPAYPQANSAAGAVSSTGLTSSGFSPLPQIPTGVLQPGAHLRMRTTIEGTSTSATPTLTLGFYAGTVGQAIGSKSALAVTSAQAYLATTTAWELIMEYDGTIRTISTTAGVINGCGICYSWLNVALTGAPTITIFPLTAALRTVSTLVTNAAIELDVGGNLSSATGTPSWTVTNFWAEVSG